MAGSPHQDDEFVVTSRPDTAVIHETRRAFSSWLRAHGRGQQLHDEMLVVLSELLSNAVDASAGGEGEVVVRAWIDEDGLALEVTNPASADFTTVSRWDLDDPLRTGGRGLVIVESLVDDLAIAPPDGRRALRVRCRRDLPARSTR